MTGAFPIEPFTATIIGRLGEHRSAVLIASPGAGKTTVLPLRLLEHHDIASKKIVMLEPRRVAARAAASRLAAEIGTAVGDLIGYRVRFDSRVSNRTRLEVVTEGVLTRMLQEDPALEPYGLVIFDEFHERSLQADLGLALALEARQVLRPDLRILVMSATMDPLPVASLLGGAPVVTVPGQLHPIETHYRPARLAQHRLARVAEVIEEAFSHGKGDTLIFLPGVGEINWVRARVADSPLSKVAAICPLHGSLSREDQDAVLKPSSRRRIILATSIAETSLTIPGVDAVVDSGLRRTSRFSARTGFTRLVTLPVTRDIADQRRGRAGRTGPGECYRVWDLAIDAGLVPKNPPEILSADLAPMVLDVAAAGFGDPLTLSWLDPPPSVALDHARLLLADLGALDGAIVTPKGREMARTGLHPRLAHLAIRARSVDASGLAAALATILTERDLLPRRGERPDADLRHRVAALVGKRSPGLDIDARALSAARRDFEAWKKRLGALGDAKVDPNQTGRLLSWAYPDRVAKRRTGQLGRFLLQNGRGAFLQPDQPLAKSEYLVAADLDDRGIESQIRLAAPLEDEALAEYLGEHAQTETVVRSGDSAAAVRAVERTRIGAIVVSERTVEISDPEIAREALVAAIHEEGVRCLDWGPSSRRLRARLDFLHRLDSAWPDVSDPSLVETVERWLEQHPGIRSLGEIDVEGVLWSLVPPGRRGEINKEAPDKYQAPTGTYLLIDYSNPEQPAVAVKLQEMFGVSSTPRIGWGKVPIVMHLLSPAGRPVQVTGDLAGFWRSSYRDVRRALRGRYPKHDWPEDPATAVPRRGPKRR